MGRGLATFSSGLTGSEDVLPYFAMEHIDGKPIARFRVMYC